MANWDVYGVGNAFLDISFLVSDDFLLEQGIEKGHTTFIEKSQLEHLISQSGKPASKSSGGSAANAMATVPRFGGHSFYSCRVGNDLAGTFFLNEMTTAGVDFNPNSNRLDKNLPTSQCLVFITPDGERSMCDYLGASNLLVPEDIDEKIVAQSNWVYAEGYLAVNPGTAAAALRLRRYADSNNTKMAITLSDYTVIKQHRASLELIIGTGVDLLFCNSEEALLWSGCADLKQAGEALLSIAKTCVITKGADGIRCFDGNKWFELPGFQVESIDTTGAGDTFAGAFLHALSRGRSYRSAGRLANLVGAVTVSSIGARVTHITRERLIQVAGL